MGVRNATEEFTIVRNADGGFTMTSITSEGRQMRTVITTNSAGNPTAYEHYGKGGEAVEKTITSKRGEDGRLVLSELSSRNPPKAPASLPPNTFVFGDGGVAQFWFLSLGPIPRDVDYFWPGPWQFQKGRLSDAGNETVTIDGSPVAASRLGFEGLPRREIWLDSQKRLLKVSTSGGNSVSIRTKRPQ
jgi:hypothetical protein